MRVAYLGPEGTHTGEAARSFDLLSGAELVPAATIRAALAMFAKAECEAAVLPIENALEGSVGATLDALAGADGQHAQIRRENLRVIEHALAVPNGLAEFRGVLSHPQALAQCARTLAEKFPRALQEPASSTAEAARMAHSRGDWAALCPREAAERAGLEIRERDCSDEPGNRTRFVLVMRNDERPTGRDRTSLVFSLDRDRPGGLRDALDDFASRGINLSRIESRPTRRVFGEYFFFLDLETHREEPATRAALDALQKRSSWLRLLGSYPRI